MKFWWYFTHTQFQGHSKTYEVKFKFSFGRGPELV